MAVPRIPERVPEMVREIATTSDGYPVVGIDGTICLARLRGRDRVIAAHDLSTGDVLWTFDVGIKDLARLARAAPAGRGAFFLPRAKRRKLEICRVSPAGKVEVVDEVRRFGSAPHSFDEEGHPRDVGEEIARSVAQLHASAGGRRAVRMVRATWVDGQRIDGEPLGWAGETLVVVGRSRFDATSLRGYRDGRSVWYAGIQTYERPVLAGDQVLLVRPLDASRVRSVSAETGVVEWEWESPLPLWRWLATPFATLLLLAEAPGATNLEPAIGARLATLLPTGVLTAPPAELGPGDRDVDLVAAEPARVLWLSAARRLVCAPLAEPGATVWEASLPDDLTGYYSYIEGADIGEPPVMVCDAGVLVVCRRRLLLLA